MSSRCRESQERRTPRRPAGGASRLFLALAEDERVWIPLQVVRQHAKGSSGASDLLQGVAQILLGRGVLAHEGRVGVLEDAVGAGDSGAQVGERRAELGHELAVE